MGSDFLEEICDYLSDVNERCPVLDHIVWEIHFSHYLFVTETVVIVDLKKTESMYPSI